MLTDNLMLKNDAIMIEDYSKLNTLKKKIEDYTLLKDKNIEYVQLWEKIFMLCSKLWNFK